ncbi:ATPase synthesis protein 25 mitochondrial [Sporothrix eucalyptigena]|uniref:ATPase synthesis protein 25 n=1 Tax=Sporothrix eucalyptigena TaxID=1812306 RepID=A0ABP0CHX2_9PEZI
MLQPTSRAASSAAYRVQLQRVLQSTPARPRCRTALEASSARTGPSQRPSSGPAASVQLPRPRWFSVSRRAQNSQDDTNSSAESATSSSSSTNPTSSSTPSTTNSTPSTSSSSDVPWYLKVNVPKHATLAPQDEPLPEIPANVPALVKPLVSFVADDLGLDSLKLLDLRALDPPAALGPDLIMLFGSARSERHLHISADRLVRWLRKYGINATADGLLGRNELKIKLRRKARRAKLLGNMAALEAAASGGETQVDDGISTQWVCVHAGTVGRTRAEGAVVDAEGRTSGFGSLRSTGTTVVVQMFTEAKRKQLDLESLWSKTLLRSVKKRTDAGEGVPEWAVEAAKSAREDQKAKAAAEAIPSAWTTDGSSAKPQNTSTGGQQQRRAFSTSARRLEATPDIAFETVQPNIIDVLTQPVIGTRDLEKISDKFASSAEDKAVIRQELEAYISRLSLPSVLDHAFSSTITDFALACNAAFRGVPFAETWSIRARFYVKAMIAGDPSFTHDGLVDLIHEMQRGGYPVDGSLYVLLLEGLTKTHTRGVPMNEAQLKAVGERLEGGIKTAISLINTMSERGEDVLTRDVLFYLIIGLARINYLPILAATADAAYGEKIAQIRESEWDLVGNFTQDMDKGRFVGFQTDLNSDNPAFERVVDVTLNANGDAPDTIPAVYRAADELQTRLEDLLRQANLPCLEDEHMSRLLAAYASVSDWARFWDLWRLPTQHGLSRSSYLYKEMFCIVAERGDRTQCIEALRRGVFEMLHEEVPILPTGAVLTQIMRCVAIADPHAADIAKNLPSEIDGRNTNMVKQAKREFVKMIRMIDAFRWAEKTKGSE